MDWLLHFLGICPDSMSHPSVLALLMGVGGSWFGLKVWIKSKLNNVTISSGTKVLTSDLNCNRLTISGTGKIITNGYKIIAKNGLDLTNASPGAICLGDRQINTNEK